MRRNPQELRQLQTFRAALAHRPAPTPPTAANPAAPVRWERRMNQSPSSVLRQAAAKVREMAAAGPVDGPWAAEYLNDSHQWGIWSTGTGFSGEDDQIASVNVEPDARWIDAFLPAVVVPLALFLAVAAG